MTAATDISGMTVEVEITLRLDGRSTVCERGTMRQTSASPFSRSASPPRNGSSTRTPMVGDPAPEDDLGLG